MDIMKNIVFYLIAGVLSASTLSLPALAGSSGYDFEEVLSRHAERIAGIRTDERGELKANFLLKVKGGTHIDNIIEDQIFSYKTSLNGYSLIVKIPIGQYYLDTTEGLFSGKAQCSTGMASSGMEVRYLNTDRENLRGLLVKNSRSCGIMGCSYVLTFGNERLLDHCENEKIMESHGDLLEIFVQEIYPYVDRDAISDFGHLGGNQMGKEALIDAGYVRNDGKMSNDYQNYQWTGLKGANSHADFLSGFRDKGSLYPQTGAKTNRRNKILAYFEDHGITDFADLAVDGVVIREHHLLGIARMVGTRALVSWLKDPARVEKTESKILSDFEKMLIGFSTCDIKKVYLSEATKTLVHPYFVDRNLEPSKVHGEFAYFHLDEEYYGIKVHKLIIPAANFVVHGLYLEASISEVQDKLDKYFPLGFYSSDEEDLGLKPVLAEDRNKKGWSTLFCTPDIA